MSAAPPSVSSLHRIAAERRALARPLRDAAWRFAVAGGQLELTFLAADVLKVRRSAAGAAEESSPAVLELWQTGTPAEAEPIPSGATLTVRTDRLTAEIDGATGHLTVRRASGELLLEEQAVTLGAGDAPHRLTVRRAADEDLYGLGQQVRGADDTSLRWTGRRRQFGPFGNVREKSCPGVNGQGNGNTTIPLLLSSLGWGFFLDNHYRHEWDCTPADRWSVEAAGGECRYYVLAGPTMPAVIEQFTRLTGRPALPPRWALGLLQSKFGYRSWDEVHTVARTFRARGIPADAIILDLFWFGGVPHFGDARRMGALAWDETAFPEPRAAIAELAALGFKLLVIEEPYVDRALPAWEEARAGGLLAVHGGAATPEGTEPVTLESWWGTGGLVDFTNPAARAWWWARHRALVADGVAGWWTDLGEPQNYDPGARYHEGRTHAAVHNLFNLAWAQALAEGEAAERPGRRPFILSRSGYAGIQRYGAALWSNDVMTAFEWLAPQVATGCNLGLSGLPYWGTDVGGFIGPVADDELYTRWFQFGALSPICRPHGQDRPTAPFEFTPRTEAICRRFAALRYRLLPYLYTHAREAWDTGLPIMRPLVLHDAADPELRDLGSEYLLGPSLLVAPMLARGDVRDVYLPAGGWTDWWTRERHEGGRWLRDVAAPLDRIPLYVADDAIVPLGPVHAATDAGPTDPLTLLLMPAGERSSYTLYEDDGVSTAYQDEAALRTEVVVLRESDRIVVLLTPHGGYPQMPAARRVVLDVMLDGVVTEVHWNGTSVARRAMRRGRRGVRVAGPVLPIMAAQRIELRLTTADAARATMATEGRAP